MSSNSIVKDNGKQRILLKWHKELSIFFRVNSKEWLTKNLGFLSQWWAHAVVKKIPVASQRTLVTGKDSSLECTPSSCALRSICFGPTEVYIASTYILGYICVYASSLHKEWSTIIRSDLFTVAPFLSVQLCRLPMPFRAHLFLSTSCSASLGLSFVFSHFLHICRALNTYKGLFKPIRQV